MHRWVDKEEHGLGEEALVLRVLQQSQVVLIELQCGLIDGRPSLVEADEAFFRVHLPVELQHALSEFRVRHDVAVGAKRDWARKTRHYVHFAAINVA